MDVVVDTVMSFEPVTVGARLPAVVGAFLFLEVLIPAGNAGVAGDVGAEGIVVPVPQCGPDGQRAGHGLEDVHAVLVSDDAEQGEYRALL